MHGLDTRVADAKLGWEAHISWSIKYCYHFKNNADLADRSLDHLLSLPPDLADLLR